MQKVVIMDHIEERRKKLLEKTRNIYSDRNRPAAIHPRYGSIYSEEYYSPKDTNGSFGIRIVLCLLLFALFLTMDYTSNTMFNVSSEEIKAVISENWEVDDLL